MPTPAADEAVTAAGSDERGVGAAAKQVAEHASAVARLELELASLELKRKVANLAVGIGLAVGAALFALYALGFAFAAAAAGLATFLDTWLALAREVAPDVGFGAAVTRHSLRSRPAFAAPPRSPARAPGASRA